MSAPVAVTLIFNCVHVKVVDPVLFIIPTGGGVSSTVTVTVPSEEHPAKSVKVRVYNVVVDGVAMGSEIFGFVRPVFGVQE